MQTITLSHVRGRSLLLPLCVAALCRLGTSDARADHANTLPPPAQRSGLTYDADIKPLFERSCFKCHGEAKQKAELRLDSRRAAIKGAKDGKVILPGRSAESKLVLAVSHLTEEEDEWMPPPEKAQALSGEEIGLIRAWIDQGAR